MLRATRSGPLSQRSCSLRSGGRVCHWRMVSMQVIRHERRRLEKLFKGHHLRVVVCEGVGQIPGGSKNQSRAERCPDPGRETRAAGMVQGSDSVHFLGVTGAWEAVRELAKKNAARSGSGGIQPAAGAPTFRRLTAWAKPPGPGNHEKADANDLAQTQSRSQTGAPLRLTHF